MPATPNAVRRTITRVAAIVLAAAPIAVAAQGLEPVRGDQRVVLTVTQGDDGWAEQGIDQRRISLRLAHAAIVHRLRVDFVDAMGEPIVDAAHWSVTLWTSNALGEDAAMTQLSAVAPELRVPRPYGLRFDAEDSITVVVTMQATGAMHGTLRAIIDYELPVQRTSRLPVLALTATVARGQHDDGAVEDAWTWRPTVDGRLVAVSGQTLASADELVLEDAATGAVLWRTRVQRGVASEAAYASGDIVRPGVALQEGRTYRMRAVYADGTRAQAVGDASTPLAVMMPSPREVSSLR